MSTHVVGIAPPDDQWKNMKAVYVSCIAAGVDVPKVVASFFGYEEPDDSGVIIELDLTPWNDDTYERQGFELDVSSLPAHVKTIRFYNRW
jgi:hypothetical protein